MAWLLCPCRTHQSPTPALLDCCKDTSSCGIACDELSGVCAGARCDAGAAVCQAGLWRHEHRADTWLPHLGRGKPRYVLPSTQPPISPFPPDTTTRRRTASMGIEAMHRCRLRQKPILPWTLRHLGVCCNVCRYGQVPAGGGVFGPGQLVHPQQPPVQVRLSRHTYTQTLGTQQPHTRQRPLSPIYEAGLQHPFIHRQS